jgi:hypothetical protein
MPRAAIVLAGLALFVSLDGVSYGVATDGNGWSAAAYATAPTGPWQLVNVAICG